MRIDKKALIAEKTAGSVLGISTGKPDDFLMRVNQTIANFKELLKTAQHIQGLAGNPVETIAGTGPAISSHNEPKRLPASGDVSRLINQVMAAGLGDVPIKELIEKLSPYTIRQIIQFSGMKEKK